MPYSIDEEHGFNIPVDIQDAIETEGKSVQLEIEKAIMLHTIDSNWKEHLRKMDELKESVQSASFEQKDPLVKYKIEAFNIFAELINKNNSELSIYLLNGDLKIHQDGKIQEARETKTDFSNTKSNHDYEKELDARKRASESANQEQHEHKPITIRRVDPKIGRNDNCPCGSGKKFKSCHGRK